MRGWALHPHPPAPQSHRGEPALEPRLSGSVPTTPQLHAEGTASRHKGKKAHIQTYLLTVLCATGPVLELSPFCYHIQSSDEETEVSAWGPARGNRGCSWSWIPGPPAPTLVLFSSHTVPSVPCEQHKAFDFTLSLL